MAHSPETSTTYNDAEDPTAELIANVSGARYPSQTRVGKTLARLAAAGQITTVDIDRVSAAAQARCNELIARHDPSELPTDESVITETPWSPTTVLDVLPQGLRPADARERQVPVSDREEHLRY
jgi:hypothetical protein